MHSSQAKRSLMAVSNNRGINLHCSQGLKQQKGTQMGQRGFVCTQMGFNGASAQAANDLKLQQGSVYVFTTFTLSLRSFMSEGYAVKRIHTTQSLRRPGKGSRLLFQHHKHFQLLEYFSVWV